MPPLTLIALLMSLPTYVIVDFGPETDLRHWSTQNDTVMGGRSTSDFRLTDEGHFVFHGEVSLENDGGFAQVRYRPTGPIELGDATHLVLRVKGDGKAYQVRLKDRLATRHSYVYRVGTSGGWETLRVPLAEMWPQFRGRRLGLDDFGHARAEELAILIGNGRAEAFRLEVDWVGLE